MNDEQYDRQAAEYERQREELANPEPDGPRDTFFQEIAEQNTQHVGHNAKES